MLLDDGTEVPSEWSQTIDYRSVNFSAGLGLGISAQVSDRLEVFFMPQGSLMLLSLDKNHSNGERFYSFGGTIGMFYWL